VKRITQLAWIAVLVATALGCSRPADTTMPISAGKAAREFATGLHSAVTVDAMMGHLAKLQEIADAHGGTRAVGTPGYDASVDYVVDVLRGKGFDVQTPEFQTRTFDSKDPVLTVGGAAVKAQPLQFSAGTTAKGVSGPLVVAPADETPGCAPADYNGLPVKDSVLLVDRGSCHFFEKEQIAAKLGAAALIIADNVDEEKMGGTLGQDIDVTIPVVSISKSDGARLRAQPGSATLMLDATTKSISARNVLAQAPRQRPGRPRYQRQRIRSRRGAGDRCATRQRAGRQQRRAVRILGR
jgi:Zn-dependent M28 family amino/carboxypeptidase